MVRLRMLSEGVEDLVAALPECEFEIMSFPTIPRKLSWEELPAFGREVEPPRAIDDPFDRVSDSYDDSDAFTINVSLRNTHPAFGDYGGAGVRGGRLVVFEIKGGLDIHRIYRDTTIPYVDLKVVVKAVIDKMRGPV